MARPERASLRAWEVDPGAAWTLDPSPILDLTTTGTGAAHEFYRVADATRLSDGWIIVADRGSSQVCSYSLQGVSIGVAGRPGDGPGERRGVNHPAPSGEAGITSG